MNLQISFFHDFTEIIANRASNINPSRIKLNYAPGSISFMNSFGISLIQNKRFMLEVYSFHFFSNKLFITSPRGNQGTISIK